MVTHKYDIPKTFKFSERGLEKLQLITDERHFRSDCEANRFCVDFVYALLQKNLLTEAASKLIEDM